MDIRDFLDMVNGKLSWEAELYEARLDIELQHFAHFTASIMYSSGNYKKSTKLSKLEEALYIPLKDREAYERRIRQQSGGKPVRSHKKSSPEKIAELKERFGLNEEEEQKE